MMHAVGGPPDGEDGGIRFIGTEAELAEVLALSRAFLFKHSTRCSTSGRALVEVKRYARGEEPVVVYGIDVIRHRSLSRATEERLGIRHESPQAILLHGGRPAWHASHHRITAEAMLAATGAELSE